MNERHHIYVDAFHMIAKRGPVGVHVDAWCEHVELPPHLTPPSPDQAGNPNVRLVTINFSPRFPNPLQVNTTGISQTLSFGGQQHRVFVPWEGVAWMQGSSKNNPLTVLLTPADEDALLEETEDAPKQETKVSHLRVVK